MLTLCSTAVWAVSLPLQGGAATGQHALEQWCCVQASIPRCSAQTRRAARHCWVLTHTVTPPVTPEEDDVHQSGSMLQALAGKPDKMHAFKCECARRHVCTFKSLMWRYSSMMAFDFFSTSSSVKAGLGREEGGGGVGALSRFTTEKKRRRYQLNNIPLTSLVLMSVCTPETISLSCNSPVRSLLGPLSRLPLSLLPLSRLPLSRLPLSLLPLSRSSVMLATRRTGSFVARLSPPLPPCSCDSLLKLLLLIWFWLPLPSRPSRPSPRSNRSKRSLSRSARSPPRSRLELDLKVVRKKQIYYSVVSPHLKKKKKVTKQIMWTNIIMKILQL